MDYEGFEGSAVYSIAVIEHPALLVGVAKVFEPTNLRLFLGSVPTEQGEKLGFVVEKDRGDADFCAALLDELEIVGLIFGGTADITGAEDHPHDLVVGLQVFFEFFGAGQG